MRVHKINTWSEFHPFLRDIEAEYGMGTSAGGIQRNRILFRGQQNSDWKLRTTLERYCSRDWSVVEYLKLTNDCRKKLESFTSNSWDLPLESEAIEYIKSKSDLFFARFPTSYYEFWSHLRHLGFPSPLLDWSASPYIAALFAFSNRQNPDKVENVSIFVFIEQPEGGKEVQGGAPRIDVQGPNIKTNARHYLQQSWYTVAIQDKTDGPFIVPHQKVFEERRGILTEQDVLVKVDIPYSQRSVAMEYLMTHNISLFSLFQTEEALLQTLAYEILEQHYL